MTARLLFIALDGADSNLIDRWSLDGTLPNLAGLRAKGAGRHLAAPHGVTDDALWANVQYGVDLGEHGRFHYMQRLAGGKMGMAFNDELDRAHFWDELSASGQRVAIIDIPKVAPPRQLNGIHLADWLVHGKYLPGPQSYPPELAAEVVATFGAAPHSHCDYVVHANEAGPEAVRGDFMRSAAMKEAAGLHYLERDAWDLFAIAFKETHCVGHYFWDMIDPDHPDYDEALRSKLGDPVRAVYQRVDQAVGKLVDAAGKGAQVIVLATTKMQPNGSIHHLHKQLSRALNRAAGEGAIAQLIRRRRRRRGRIEIVPYGENGTAIRINRTGPDRERLLHLMESTFGSLKDADTGAMLLDAMYHPSADYPGARAAQLPDLLVRYRAGKSPASVTAPGIGRIAGHAPTYRAGNHACGPFVIGDGVGLDRIGALQDIGGAVTRELAR